MKCKKELRQIADRLLLNGMLDAPIIGYSFIITQSTTEKTQSFTEIF